MSLEPVLENSFQAFADLILVLDYKGFIVDSRMGMLLPPVFPGEISRRELKDVFPRGYGGRDFVEQERPEIAAKERIEHKERRANRCKRRPSTTCATS